MASTFSLVRAVRVVMCAGGSAAVCRFRRRHRRPLPPLQAQRRARGARQAAERVRGRARRLRRAARGARGKADGHGRAGATRRRRRSRPRRPPPRRPTSRCRRVRRAAAGRSGALPVYGNASAMSKIFNPDIAVIGNFVGAAGKNSVNPSPALALRGSRSDLPGGRRSVRARRLLSRLLARGRRDRGRLPDADVAARRTAGQGRQAQAAGRQGEHAPRALPAPGSTSR